MFVTHDQVEAMTLGDRVVIMRDGRVQQIGTPLQVYGKPANKFVAGFIGAPAMNFIDVTVRSEAGAVLVETEGLRLTVGPAEASALAAHNGRRVILGMRPEHLVLGDGAPGLGFDARVEVVEQLGSGDIAGDEGGRRQRHRRARARGNRHRAWRSGSGLSAQAGRLHFFDPGDRTADLPVKSSGNALFLLSNSWEFQK